MRKWRIMLADDHVVLREGLAALINNQSDMQVVGAVNDGAEVVQETQATEPDVVVIDVSMPTVSGVQAANALQQLAKPPYIIALTRHGEPAYVRQLLQAGAHGYVLKQSAATELLNAIRAVVAGGMYLDPALTDQVVTSYVQTHARAAEITDTDLSERETDVVRLTAFGYSNKEIAKQLGISVKTVETYKARAMEKLGLHSRAGLVRYAMQQGWLDQV